MLSKFKKALSIIVLLMILSGCTKINNNENYIELINAVITTNNNNVNRVSIGYKYYLPFGVNLISDNDSNQVYKILNTKMYLYVDYVSYYYKNKLNYKIDENNYYYYEPINHFDKTGYILINQENDKYFVKIVYNYAKIEIYTNKEDLSKIITYATIILNSIEYNDLVIATNLENSANLSSDIDYKINAPEDSASKFSQYLEEYVQEEEVIEKLPEE